MSQRTWVILGATSIIAKEFAYLAAAAGYNLRLVGRDQEQLEIKAADITLRFGVTCDVVLFGGNALSSLVPPQNQELDLFIAQSDFTDNAFLTESSLKQLLETNIQTTALFIHQYLQLKQSRHHVIFLSSVAALRGRAKNSLYGGSKAAIEVYLQGLQQAASKTQHLTIARLGYIDTQQTYGKPGIFHAALPKNCAKACLKAVQTGKRLIVYPVYWKAIMTVFCLLPFFVFRKMRKC